LNWARNNSALANEMSKTATTAIKMYMAASFLLY
jgi:hypothetical protein